MGQSGPKTKRIGKCPGRGIKFLFRKYQKYFEINQKTFKLGYPFNINIYINLITNILLIDSHFSLPIIKINKLICKKLQIPFQNFKIT